ncbi:MAG: hypothetical protein MPN21_21055 [Thermoanaerobaculia bacterium]|nr:hypothetical protein [Thermoanaerobaculia bacterium]
MKGLEVADSTATRQRGGCLEIATCAEVTAPEPPGYLLVCLLAFACVTLGPAFVGANEVDPIEPPNDRRFVHRMWTVDDGLPVNNLTDIEQTPDGWLWIGTFDGLLRFDGAQFFRYDSLNTPALGSNRIVELLRDAGGALWILSEQGHLTRYRDGEFEPVAATVPATGRIGALAPAEDGALWVASRAGLRRVVDGNLVDGPKELADQPISAVFAGSSGRLWVATRTGKLALVISGSVQWITEARLPPTPSRSTCRKIRRVPSGCRP